MRLLRLADGEPITSGTEDDPHVVVRTETGALDVVPRASADPAHVVTHDPHAVDPSQQFAVSRLDGPSMTHVPVGVFRDVERPTYEDLLTGQVHTATEKMGAGDLMKLLNAGDTWTIE
jgi:2-oxoglutarate ferredoxin oxidoreductase subunit beta